MKARIWRTVIQLATGFTMLAVLQLSLLPSVRAHALITIAPTPVSDKTDQQCNKGNGGGDNCPEGGCPVVTGSDKNVSFYTGYENLVQTDMTVNGIFPVQMVRQYNSGSEYDSSLGYGWSFSHDRRLFEYPDGSVTIRSNCGASDRYLFTGGSYSPESGVTPSSLIKNPDTSFDLTYLSGRRWHFDDQGRLTERYDVRGNWLKYSYDTRGKLPLMGSTPNGIDPSKPITVAYMYRLVKIEVYSASGMATGNSVDISYNDATGRITGISSNDGRTVTYNHDDAGNAQTKGNLIQVNGLNNKVSTYKYEDFEPGTQIYQDHHNITEVKASVGSSPIVLTYDAEDRVINETNNGSVFVLDWSQYGFQTTVTETNTDDQGANQTTAIRVYTYNGLGFITKVVDSLGNQKRYQIDNNGRWTRENFFEEQGTLSAPNLVLIKTINRTFRTDGRKINEQIILDRGELITKSWAYDDTRIATETTSSSADLAKIFKTETLYNYDGAGKPTTVQASRRYKDNGTDYLETSYTYNSNGDVLTTTLPDGHIIQNEYSAVYGGRYVTKTTHFVSGAAVPNLEETYTYDTKGNRTSVTDARGNATTTTYDDKNRRTTITNAKSHLTTYVYDVNDNLINIIRDRSAINDQLDNTKLTYDGKNQLTQIDRTDASGTTFVMRSTLRYDSTGNVIVRGDANGVETTLTYDLENRLTRITDDEGSYIEYTLNALNHRIATKYYKTGGVLVRESSAVFDDLDRQEQLIGAISQTTTFTYDAVGNRITAVDALSRPATVYTYDTLSRLTNIKDANAKDTVYSYDDRDQLRFVTDPRSLQTEYQYNELGQLVSLISPDTGITDYTYDLAGNRLTQKDARNITVTFGYDELNRITSKTYPIASLNVTYGYDAGTNGIGKLTSMSDAEGSTTYEYDERGNLTKTTRITNMQPYVTQYVYDFNDRLVQLAYPSGRVVNYTRNTLGQVTLVTTTPSGGSVQTIASGITYLPFGSLENMSWGNGLSLGQTYDSDYRLTSQVLGSVYDRAYGYDVVNNIKSITDNTPSAKNQAFNYDVLDRLGDANGTYGLLDYAYDDVGNRVSLTLDGGVPEVYNYSATANQLDDIDGVSIGYDANGNTTIKDALTFAYDDTNRMMQAGTTSYGFNGRGERVRKSGGVTTLYHYDDSGNLLFESDTGGSTQVEYIWLGSQRLATVQGGSLYFMHTDHLGTVQLLTDGAGAVVWSGDYKPFGGVDNITGSVTNNLRFAGQYYDAETQLHYNYFRDYDPNIGRYIESDPIGLGDGVNTYWYVKGNPIINIDREGLACGSGALGDALVPDNPGLNNFTPCCNKHDSCYGTECKTLTNKALCDGLFLACMLISCSNTGESGCSLYAVQYYIAVTTFGGLSFF